jgi:hypothetical protein
VPGRRFSAPTQIDLASGMNQTLKLLIVAASACAALAVGLGASAKPNGLAHAARIVGPS